MDANICQLKKSRIPIRKVAGAKGIPNPNSLARDETCATTTDGKTNCEYQNSSVCGDETSANMNANNSILGGVNRLQRSIGMKTKDTKIDMGVNKATHSNSSKSPMNSKCNMKPSFHPNEPKKLSTITKPIVCSGLSAPIRKVIGKNNQMDTKTKNSSMGIEEAVNILPGSRNDPYECANTDQTNASQDMMLLKASDSKMTMEKAMSKSFLQVSNHSTTTPPESESVQYDRSTRELQTNDVLFTLYRHYGSRFVNHIDRAMISRAVSYAKRTNVQGEDSGQNISLDVVPQYVGGANITSNKQSLNTLDKINAITQSDFASQLDTTNSCNSCNLEMLSRRQDHRIIMTRNQPHKRISLISLTQYPSRSINISESESSDHNQIINCSSPPHEVYSLNAVYISDDQKESSEEISIMNFLRKLREKEQPQLLESSKQYRKLLDSDDIQMIDDIPPPSELYFSDLESSCENIMEMIDAITPPSKLYISDSVSSFEHPMKMWSTQEAKYKPIEVSENDNQSLSPKDTVEESTSMDSIENMSAKEELELKETGKYRNIFKISDDKQVTENVTQPLDLYFSEPLRSYEDLLKVGTTNEIDQIETKLKSDEFTSCNNQILYPSFYKKDSVEVISLDLMKTMYDKEKLEIHEESKQEIMLPVLHENQMTDDITPIMELNFSDPLPSYEDKMNMWNIKEQSLLDPVAANYKPIVVSVNDKQILSPSFYEENIVKEITSLDLIENNHENDELKFDEIGTQENVFTSKTSMKFIFMSSVKHKESSMLISAFTNVTDERSKHEEPIKQKNIFKAICSIDEIANSSSLMSTATSISNNIKFRKQNFMCPPPRQGNVVFDSDLYRCKMQSTDQSRDLKKSHDIEKLTLEEIDRQRNMLRAKLSISESSISSIKNERYSSFASNEADVSDNSLSFINARLQNSMSPSTRPSTVAVGWEFNAPFQMTPRIKINRTAPLRKCYKNDSESRAHGKMFFKYSEVRRCQSPARYMKKLCPLKQSQLIEATASTEWFLENSKQPRRTHPNPISAYTLDICKKPLLCPENKCNLLVSFPQFLRHLIVDHNYLRMERVFAGACKTVFLNVNVVNLKDTKCHAVFLVRDRLLDITSGKYCDLLPIMIMTRYVHINEIMGNIPEHSDDLVVESKKDILLFLWPVTIIEKQIPLKVSITIWPIDDRCQETRYCYVGEVLSLRTPATVENLIKSANLIILNPEQIKTLTNDGKQSIPMQFIVE